ncbi:Uma2 family endonuclease [Coleofasciculus sp. FACHB-712]|nr:Uma2 family endonuclease [Coleofasciculus sp. FACHB-712]
MFLWEENYVVPIFVLKVVSQTYRGGYDEKQTKYAQLSELYYVIYNPRYLRGDQHDAFEVDRLVDS